MKYQITVWIEPNRPGFDVMTKTMFESDSFKPYPNMYIGKQLSTQKPIYETVNGIRYQVFTDTIRASNIVKAVKARANWFEKLKFDCLTLSTVYADITTKFEYSNIEALALECKDKAIKGNQNIYDDEADKLTRKDFERRFKDLIVLNVLKTEDYKDGLVVNGRLWSVDELVRFVGGKMFGV